MESENPPWMKMYFLLENVVDFAKLAYCRVVEIFPSSLDVGFKYVLISSRTLGKWSNLSSIFFKWVGSTTNWIISSPIFALPRPKVSVLPLAMLEHFRWGDWVVTWKNGGGSWRGRLFPETKNFKSLGLFFSTPRKKGGRLEDVEFFQKKKRQRRE